MSLKNWRSRTDLLRVGAGLAGLLMAAPSAHAVEAATSFYILGSKTTMSGYLPPPAPILAFSRTTFIPAASSSRRGVSP